MMKTIIKFYSIILVLAMSSCVKDDIESYSVDNSAMVFQAQTVSFSMRGLTEPSVNFSIPLDLIGQITDYDRPINVQVLDSEQSNADEGKDFRIVEAGIKAGEGLGEIVIEANMLPEGSDDKSVVLQILPNEYFISGYPALSTANIIWSNDYVRPANSKVWQSWFLFFCDGYSKNLHKVLLDVFGEEIEYYAYKRPSEEEAEQGYIFKNPSWWYPASRQLREYVSQYDAEHLDAPLMHSADYERYPSYMTPVGAGTKPEVVPTILETLKIM